MGSYLQKMTAYVSRFCRTARSRKKLLTSTTRSQIITVVDLPSSPTCDKSTGTSPTKKCSEDSSKAKPIPSTMLDSYPSPRNPLTPWTAENQEWVRCSRSTMRTSPETIEDYYPGVKIKDFKDSWSSSKFLPGTPRWLHLKRRSKRKQSRLCDGFYRSLSQ